MSWNILEAIGRLFKRKQKTYNLSGAQKLGGVGATKNRKASSEVATHNDCEISNGSCHEKASSRTLMCTDGEDDRTSAALSRAQSDAQFGRQSLPIFVFPTSLHFYSKDSSSHKQVLTLYNPYDFSLHFQVFSTSPQKYTVADAEGVLKQRNCVDIVIRHVAPLVLSNIGVVDKFRVQITEHGSAEVLGRKDIASTLLEYPDDSTPEQQSKDVFQQIGEENLGPRNRRTIPRGRDVASVGSAQTFVQTPGPSWWMILVAILCVTGLSLPTHYPSASKSKQATDTAEASDIATLESMLPEWLHLTLAQKLVAAYILGLLTVVFLRQ